MKLSRGTNAFMKMKIISNRKTNRPKKTTHYWDLYIGRLIGETKEKTNFLIRYMNEMLFIPSEKHPLDTQRVFLFRVYDSFQ